MHGRRRGAPPRRARWCGRRRRPAVRAKTGTSLGELAFGRGRIRIAGALLPAPTERNYHPFGLSSYALTYTGYQLFDNLLDYQRPAGR